MDPKNTQELINQLQHKLQNLTVLQGLIDSVTSSLKVQIENLQCYANEDKTFEKSIVDLKVALSGIPELQIIKSASNTSANSKGRRRGRRKGIKTKSQEFEKLFKEHGPMHVTEIVPIAEARGIELVGKKDKKLQVRDNLYGSKKFYNFGGNVWGLVGQEVQGGVEPVEPNKVRPDSDFTPEKIGAPVNWEASENLLRRVG